MKRELKPELGPSDYREFRREEIEESIAGRFQAQVGKNYDRPAIIEADNVITYGELNARANTVAHWIARQSLPLARPVAILFDRQLDSITAVLGLLKAGHFYVSIDASHPLARNRFIIEDAEAIVVLTNTTLAEMARQLSGSSVRILNIEKAPKEGSENPLIDSTADALCHLQYTSGSTGQPKGVIQNQRNILHSVFTYTNGLRIGPSDRVCPSRNFFVPLLNGASIVALDPKREGVVRLKNCLARQAVTIYNSVPAVFRNMIELLEPRDRFESIRIVHLEGEQIYRSDFDAFCQHFGAGSVLVNRLAATETGTIRWCFLDRSSQFSGSRIPVGYSIPDKEAILCDDSNNPVTAGEIGQILVRSQYLALGYWRRPELTASVFTMEPNGLRTYATGDLGRLSNEGVLECLDRKDFQIKIRGNRIEAGEVEAVLLATPGVREAVVVAEGDRSDNRELLAYVVRDTISSLSARDLREYAAARLPGHMVPEGFVFIDGALPRTPNGKVDRLSLPKPTVRESLESNALPRTPIEHEVARIWAQALRRDQVGINEEFLELGGHSLAAMQIIARINNKYGVELKLRSFIGPFTVAATALEISQQMAAMTDQETLEQLLAEVGISPGKESGTSGLD